jgi:hypothetical protein
MGQIRYVCSWHPGGPHVFEVVEDPRVKGVLESHGTCEACAERIWQEFLRAEREKRKRGDEGKK